MKIFKPILMLSLLLFGLNSSFSAELNFQKGSPYETTRNKDLVRLGKGYSKDNYNVYYRGTVVKDASINSFEYLEDGYAKDSWKVYYRGKVIKDASAHSFECIADGYAKDNWRV